MKKLTPLFFPETNPGLPLRGQLLLFFDKISYYRLVPPEDSTAETDVLALKGLSRGYAPVSLNADDSSRFQRLLGELKGHGGEFYSGFLSALSSGLGHDRDEAVWSLIASMGQDSARQARREARREIVWQAMLLLQLAETYTEEEKEIAARLSAIEKKQTDLFEALKSGDDPLPLPHSLDLAAVAAQKANRLPLDYDRLTKAWARLFVRDRSESPPWIMATARQEAAALVFDTYEHLQGRPPQVLAQFSLPSLEGLRGNEVLTARETYRTVRRDLLGEISRTLWEIANRKEKDPSSEAGPDALPELAARWEEAATGLPRHEPWRLVFYSLPGLPLLDLFRRLADAEAEEEGPGGPEPAPNGILAVLRQD